MPALSFHTLDLSIRISTILIQLSFTLGHENLNAASHVVLGKRKHDISSVETSDGCNGAGQIAQMQTSTCRMGTVASAFLEPSPRLVHPH